MKKQKVIVNQVYDINPVGVRFIGPSYDPMWHGQRPLIDGWQMNVNFKGDIMSLVNNLELTKEYGLLPEHSEILYRGYSEKFDVTHVKYLFDCGLFKKGQKRAYAFKDKIQAQMVNPTVTQTILPKPENKIVPVAVSKVPKQSTYNGDDGYKVSVQYNGCWDEYPPIVLTHLGYNPNGGKIIDFDCNHIDYITDVVYFFKTGVFDSGIKHAWEFIDKVNAKIKANNPVLDVSKFYTPVAVLPYDIYYKGDTFEKVTLSVQFGNIYAQIKIVEGCITEQAHEDFGVKRLPVPDYGDFDAYKNASNDYYVVRYNFYGSSFADAFFDMNRFKAKMMSMMNQQRKNENTK